MAVLRQPKEQKVFAAQPVARPAMLRVLKREVAGKRAWLKRVDERVAVRKRVEMVSAVYDEAAHFAVRAVELAVRQVDGRAPVPLQVVEAAKVA